MAKYYWRLLHWIYDFMYRQAIKQRIMSGDEMWVWRARIAGLRDKSQPSNGDREGGAAGRADKAVRIDFGDCNMTARTATEGSKNG